MHEIMKTSEQISEIIKALVKAQKKIHGIPKDSNNPHYKSKYASLESTIETLKDALNESDLAYCQVVSIGEEFPILVTRLMHISGQWIEGSYPLNPVKDDPQGLGSALTYARRYSLQSIVGMYAVDDDAELASGHSPISAMPQQVSSRPPIQQPLISGTKNICKVCGSEMSPSKQKEGQFYCKACFIKNKEAKHPNLARPPG
jgi:hypothetical protein